MFILIMGLLKLFLWTLGIIYFLFSLISSQKFPELEKLIKNKYIFFDLVLIFTLLYLVFVKRNLVGLLPLGLLIYCYTNNVNTNDCLWYSADGLSSGILLSTCLGLK